MKKITGIMFAALLAFSAVVQAQNWRTGATNVASLITAPCSTANAILYNAATPCSSTLTFDPAGSLITSRPVSITDTTDSTSTTTGSLKTAGGLGVAKKSFFGDTIYAKGGVFDAAAIRIDKTAAATPARMKLFVGDGTSGTTADVNYISNLNTDLVVLTGATGATESLRVTVAGSVVLPKTITAPATTGAQTINKSTGRVNFAAAATSLVVTNSLATADSICHVTKATNDATMRLGACVAAAGTITIYADVAPAAETAVNFTVTN